MSTKKSFVPINRNGGYAVMTSTSMPWLEGPTEKTKGKKQKASSIIIHPIYARCSECTDDPYWKSLFMTAATGKFPRGFSSRDGLLLFKRGTKVQRIEVPEDPDDAFTVCKQFFQTTAALKSELDQEQERQEIRDQQLAMTSLSTRKWSDIKQKRLQKILITDFVHRTGRHLNLTLLQKNHMKTLINIGFLAGYFTSESIEFEDGEIKRIIGIKYDEKTNKFIFDFTHIKMPKISKTRTKYHHHSEYLSFPISSGHAKISFVDLWVKFLESINAEYLICRSHSAEEDLSISIDDSRESRELYDHSEEL